LDPGKLELAAWEVPAVALVAEQAVEILAAGVGQTTWAPGGVLGPALRYWTSGLRTAGALLARQSYLPAGGADESGTIFRARWEPVVVGDDRVQVERLARAMPDACRALARDAAGPPQTNAANVLSIALGTLVDHLVRNSAGPAENSPGRHSS